MNVLYSFSFGFCNKEAVSSLSELFLFRYLQYTKSWNIPPGVPMKLGACKLILQHLNKRINISLSLKLKNNLIWIENSLWWTNIKLRISNCITNRNKIFATCHPIKQPKTASKEREKGKIKWHKFHALCFYDGSLQWEIY